MKKNRRVLAAALREKAKNELVVVVTHIEDEAALLNAESVYLKSVFPNQRQNIPTLFRVGIFCLIYPAFSLSLGSCAVFVYQLDIRNRYCHLFFDCGVILIVRGFFFQSIVDESLRHRNIYICSPIRSFPPSVHMSKNLI